VIDTLTANQTIGIWMLREINTDAFPELQNTSNLTTDQLVSLLESKQTNTQESIELVINY
jgi:hypothetical protein